MSITTPSIVVCLCLAIAPALVSCRQLNPRFCAAHPEDVDCARLSGIDAGACTRDDQCPESTPICDTVQSRCVQCTASEPGACTGVTPVCGGDGSCRGCAQDSECVSLTCLPDRACAPLLDVLYVSPDATDLATCMPDDHCSLARALGLVDGTKATIRLDPAVYSLAATLTLPNDLHLVGRDAVIDRSAGSPGATLNVPPAANITIDYLTVKGGDGTSGHGIVCLTATLTLRQVTVQDNGGAGVLASDCMLAIADSRIVTNQDVGISQSNGSLALTRSVVRGNAGGGLVLLRAGYDLENDVIAGNGGPGSAVGGMLLSGIAAAASHVFAFNTVAQNQAGTAGGVACASLTSPVAMTSSIVFGNGGGVQVEGSGCQWTYSDLGPVAVAGTGNLSSDPQFVDPAHNDFHLQVSSPARDAADPAATLAVDIDGETRPQGAGRDMGADEIH
jgi:hypothetical protein